MTIDPRITFFLAVAVAIEQAIGGGSLSLTNAIPAAWIPTVQAWCNLLGFSGTTIIAVLSGMHAWSPPPAPPVTTQAVRP